VRGGRADDRPARQSVNAIPPSARAAKAIKPIFRKRRDDELRCVFDAKDDNESELFPFVPGSPAVSRRPGGRSPWVPPFEPLWGSICEICALSDGEDFDCGSIVLINRYPKRGRVSTNRGESAESPSAPRIRFTALFKPFSKSTKVSAGHSAFWSSSRLTSSPGRSRSISKT